MENNLLEDLKEEKGIESKIIDSIENDFNNDEKQANNYQPKINDIFFKK